MADYVKEWERDPYIKVLLEEQSGDDWNEIVTETAGFEPLEVKFKRMEEAGYRAQFQESDFTSSDLRSIYLNPDFAISEEDELEDIQEKDLARAQYVQQLLQDKKRLEATIDDPSKAKVGKSSKQKASEPVEEAEQIEQEEE